MELNSQKDKPEEYERIRQTCNTTCKYTTWQFHHWLTEKGYIIIASLKLKNKRDLITSIDKDLLHLMDEQIRSGKCNSRSQLIENAIAQYIKSVEGAESIV